MFFDIQPDRQEASQIIENRSQKLPKSSQDPIVAVFGGLLGAILALLGAILAHLGALGRHLAAKDVAA